MRMAFYSDYVNKCMEYEVEVSRPRGRPEGTWREAVEKDSQVHKLNMEDAVDCSRWRKLIKYFDDQDGCEWMNISAGTGSPR